MQKLVQLIKSTTVMNWNRLSHRSKITFIVKLKQTIRNNVFLELLMYCSFMLHQNCPLNANTSLWIKKNSQEKCLKFHTNFFTANTARFSEQAFVATGLGFVTGPRGGEEHGRAFLAYAAEPPDRQSVKVDRKTRDGG